ncbi:hypothetical protein BVRB_6g140690 [Beta vulgaris subsp. vulgaris]|nr:hypothetical protein BVRB_6g140690 [Beta vulgaris subsp. vulgaris]
MVTCCFCIPSIQDEKPRPFDPDDIYQQFVFSKTQTFFNSNMMLAKSIAYDGHPPEFLRREGWTIDGKPLKNSMLREARGLDSSLRAHLPDFDFPASQECSNSVVVGKWCCPFIFIKEGTQIDQIKYSVFYEMTLEQRWERIFTADRNNTQENAVTVDVVVPTEMVSIAGQEATQEEGINDNGVVWFYGRGAAEHVGVSSLIIERMMWEEGRVGWFKNKEKQVRVTKNEEYTGVGDWISFSCYLLVETFVLRRNDGTILLTYDFRHTHHIRSKWE